MCGGVIINDFAVVRFGNSSHIIHTDIAQFQSVLVTNLVERMIFREVLVNKG